MSVQTRIYHQYKTLITHWPLDPLRPTINFRDMLQHRVDAYFGTHVEADSSLPTQNTPITPAAGVGTGTTGAAAEAEGKPVRKFDAIKVSREMNAVKALLEDRFLKTYPLGENMMRPKANPEYYEKLMRELEEAPGRSWWRTKLNSWKGWIRMQ